MPLTNRRNQEIMHKKDRDIKYFKFKYKKGIEDMRFNMGKDDIINLLGTPNEINERKIDDTLDLYYDNISVYLHFDEAGDYISFHPDSLLLGNSFLVTNVTSESEALEYISNYHDRNHLLMNVEENFDLDKMIFFKNIGLTIWIEEGLINDICVEPILLEEDSDCISL